MQHAISQTKDYAIVFEAPWYMEMHPGKFFTQNVEAIDLMKADFDGKTKIHVIRLSDGQVTTIQEDKWSLILHYGNAFQVDNDTIILEGAAYEKPTDDIYGMYRRDQMDSIDAFTSHDFGMVFKRYKLFLKNVTYESEELLKAPLGAYEFPQYNPKHEATSRNQYYYLFRGFAKDKIDESYNWPMYKYDVINNKMVGMWGPNLTITQEPRFIPDPDGTEEDDGIIVTTIYDVKKKANIIVVIDPKTMTTLQTYPLPHNISLQYHNMFWSFAKLREGGNFHFEKKDEEFIQ